jgi:hypothetical protein
MVRQVAQAACVSVVLGTRALGEADEARHAVERLIAGKALGRQRAVERRVHALNALSSSTSSSP